VKQLDPISILKQFGVEYFDRGSDKDWVTVICPFHNDGAKEASEGKGGINKNSGAFNCFSCGHPSNIFSFVATKMGVPEATVHAFNDNIFGTRNKVTGIEPALIAVCHKNLLGDLDTMQKMKDKHGITIDSIRKFELGIYPHTGRVTIPVKVNGSYLDLRQYKYGAAEGEAKIISNSKAKTQLFIAGDMDADTIYVTEGEFKAILLNQYGFNAVSSTHGAKSWTDSFTAALRGKHIVLVYDIDKPGRMAAHRRCIELFRSALSIKNVLLTPVEDIPNGDITDYFVKKLYTVEDFKALVENTPVYQPYIEAYISKDRDNDPIEVKLATSSRAELNGYKIKTNCVVSAKDTSPYIIPKKVKCVCTRSKDYCTNCKIYDKPEEGTFEFSSDSSDILDLVSLHEGPQLKKLFLSKSGVYSGCKICNFEIVESFNVEELRVIPQLEVGHASDEQVTRRVFYVGQGIATNASYNIEARVAPMPNDGHATLIVYDAQPAIDNLDDFSTKEDLSIFKPKEWTVESVEEKLSSIYDDFESNVTRIKMRKDLHLVYDLVYHSCLYIPYEGRNIKGWTDVLVIGDSGQGKSECSSRMLQHYKAGERVDSKRASVAGIVGGLQETSGRWFITWGTIPLNDRRLVILEEVKGMGVGELTKLTDMRSSGFAEIHKIERARTYARTRLIWISNPRSDGKISSYNYGVDAVRELIGSLEDIRRFDLVTAVASGEVPINVINSTHVATSEHIYTSNKCAELVQWAWSRKEYQIVILPETVTEALAAATRLSTTYSSACPIVEPSDQRLKMLRMATACAARTYSTDDGEMLIVRPCHVTVVERLMERCYRSKALGYFEYSQVMKGEEAIGNTTSVKDTIKSMPHASDCARGILESETLRVEDIMNFTDWPLDKCNEFIGVLVRNNCLKRSKRGGFRKTSAFIEQLKALDREGLENKTFKELIQAGSEI